MIQQGQRNLFETMVRFCPGERGGDRGSDWKNLDGLNYLEGRTLDFVDEQAFRGTVAAHVDGGVPVITMDMGELSDTKLGEMFYFFELSCGLSAYMLGVNPFNQPGVEFYNAICSSSWVSPATKSGKPLPLAACLAARGGKGFPGFFPENSCICPVQLVE